MVRLCSLIMIGVEKSLQRAGGRAVARSEAVDPSSLRRKGQTLGPLRERREGRVGERERLPPVITTKFTTEIQEDKMIPSRGPLSCVLS